MVLGSGLRFRVVQGFRVWGLGRMEVGLGRIGFRVWGSGLVDLGGYLEVQIRGTITGPIPVVINQDRMKNVLATLLGPSRSLTNSCHIHIPKP